MRRERPKPGSGCAKCFTSPAQEAQVEPLDDGLFLVRLHVGFPRRHLQYLPNSLADLSAVKEIHTSKLDGSAR